MNELRNKRDRIKFVASNDPTAAPVDRVVSILADIRARAKTDDVKVIKDLSWCIQTIQSNKLYDVEYGENEEVSIFLVQDADMLRGFAENTRNLKKRRTGVLLTSDLVNNGS